MGLTHTVIDSPVDELTIVGEDDAVVGVYFTGRRPEATALGSRVDSGFARVTEQLAEYFAGQRTEFDLPLRPHGPAFDQRVWAILQTIPYGETRSYGELAHQLGEPGAAQAVGAANGRNPLPLIIPCHRVIGADGSLTGFGGGLHRKRLLLELEEPDSVKADRLF